MTNERSELWHWRNIARHQARISSQNGEDGVLLYLLWLLGIERGRCFEIGASLINGNLECNTAVLLNDGWDGVVLDREEITHPLTCQETVTRDNIKQIMGKYNRLEEPAPRVVSLDIDGMDYWVWSELTWFPDIFIVEYNAHRDPRSEETIPYSPDFRWDGSDYFGASGGAMLDLGHAKGYKLAAVVNCLNMFFVRDDAVPDNFEEPPIPGPIRRHPSDRVRPWVRV